jgi:hypothetical protein
MEPDRKTSRISCWLQEDGLLRCERHESGRGPAVAPASHTGNLDARQEGLRFASKPAVGYELSEGARVDRSETGRRNSAGVPPMMYD